MAASRKAFKDLGPADLFYIEQKRTLSVEQLAKDVGATKAAVEKALAQLPPPAPPPPAPPPPPNPRVPLVRDDGVTIMTPTASEHSDTATARNQGNYVESNRDRIFQPRPERPSR